MGTKKYFASKDSTITNAFKSDLSTRGSGSNMGASDILEVFSIYQQISSSSDGASQELSRALLQFPISGSSAGQIYADRTDGTIPASGSVKFYLNLFNAKHGGTLPRDITVNLMAVSGGAWTEGTGLDMDEYRDLGQCNWEKRQSGVSWGKIGGDYWSGSYNSGTTLPKYTYTFTNGDEDLSLDITSMVEEMIAGRTDKARQNYGFGLFLTGTQEAYVSNSSGVDGAKVLHNPGGATDSYYTKKFFARGSQFFFNRPNIEARWDSSTKDHRGSFVYSSSLATGPDNVNTLYLYNYVRGQLKNIPGVTTVYVQLFSGSSDNSEPHTIPLELAICGGAGTAISGGVAKTNHHYVTGGLSTTTGIYTASVALTASTTAPTKIFDVWGAGIGAVTGTTVQSTQYFTGSFTPSKLYGSDNNPTNQYVTKITNLKDLYSTDEEPRLRVYTREKNRTPTVYTVATADAQPTLVEDAYFKIVRLYDMKEVISYGTGSLVNNYTRLSYDVSGSYFDLDMSLLEADYAYGIQFAYYLNGVYKEQKELFKFRVEE